MNELDRAMARIKIVLDKATNRVTELNMLQIEVERDFPGTAKAGESYQALRRENEHETGYAAGLSRALYELRRARAEENGDDKA